jgi:putative ABC transport system permease protein
MNLAYRDIRHNLLRFVLTCFGLSLLLGVVIVITGVYRGLIDDALRQARSADADLWVVQAGTNGPFAEASRIPGDTREVVARVYGVARGGGVQTSDQINAVIAKITPYVQADEVAGALARWKHLTTLTQTQQETLLTKEVIEKSRRQQLMILVLLVIVSAVIIALIVYTMTMDKLRSIATLKFVGAPDRVIVGLIVQQALALGLVGFAVGLALLLTFQGYFPRRLVILPEDVAVVFGITVAVCLAASSLGVRLALKIDPSVALSTSG